MKKLVISQPMLFPWVGMFEQIQLADHFIHYDDAQFSKGSLFNRVQVKTEADWKWMTVPLKNVSLGDRINEIKIDEKRDWKNEHISLLEAMYNSAPYCSEMLEIVQNVYALDTNSLSKLTQASIETVAKYFELSTNCQFETSSSLGIQGVSTERILRIAQATESRVYITGHGAKKYLDHNMLERSGIRTEYLDYRRKPYPQLHGDFNPHVSILDLIANCGKDGRSKICSPSVYWKVFLDRDLAKAA